MDLLWQPDDPIAPLPDTPYLAQGEWQGQEFITYPSHHGKAGWFPMAYKELGVAPPPPPLGQIDPLVDAEAPGFLQTWLYFGILAEFLYLNRTAAGEAILEDNQRLEEISMLHREFTTVKNNEKLLTGRPVLDKLGLISERAKQAPDLAQRLTHLARCLRTAAWALNSVQVEIPFPVRYSISVLCEILQNAIFILGALAQPSISLDSQSFGRGYIEPGGAMERKMLESGWCLSEMDVVRSRPQSLISLHFLSQLKKPHLGVHDKCRPPMCNALQINLQKYTPRHTLDSCHCASIRTDAQIIAAILTQGDGYPILQVTGLGSASDDLQINILRYTPGMQYAALSHVWADGLGNPREMALPRCQMRFLAGIVKSLMARSGSHLEGTHLFWLDTLCCPIEEPLKAAALQRIADVYRNAAHVLVLDRGLMQYTAKSHPAELLLRTFAASRWMKRLWTLQEASLAPCLWVQYQDDTVPVAELLTTLRDVGWQDDIRLYRIYLDISDQLTEIQSFMSSNDAPSRPTLFSLQRLLHPRSVSVPSDEPLCINTLMRLTGTASLMKTSDLDRRMAVVWKALAEADGGISPRVLFFSDKSINLDGWRWAPQSFLGSSTPASLLTIYDRAARFLPSTLPDGSVNKGKITPLGLRVQMSGFRIRAVPHIPGGHLHPWDDLVHRWNTMLYLYNPGSDKWYRLTDLDRGSRVTKATKKEMREYDDQMDNYICGKTHNENCVLLYDSSFTNTAPFICCLGQVVNHTTLDPILLSKVAEPENLLFVTRGRTVVLSDVALEEVALLRVVRQLAKEVVANATSATPAGENTQTIRNLFKRQAKAAWEREKDMQKIMSINFGEPLDDHAWTLPPNLFPHDIVMEQLPSDQVWIVD